MEESILCLNLKKDSKILTEDMLFSPIIHGQTEEPIDIEKHDILVLNANLTMAVCRRKSTNRFLYALFVSCYSTKFRRYGQIFKIITSIIIDKSKAIVYNSEY